MNSSIITGLIANFIVVLSSLFLVPIYLREIGPEGYSVISFVGSLLAMMVIVELGAKLATKKLVSASYYGKDKDESETVTSVLFILFLVIAVVFLVLLNLSNNVILSLLDDTSDLKYLLRKLLPISAVVCIRWMNGFLGSVLTSTGKVTNFYTFRIAGALTNLLGVTLFHAMNCLTVNSSLICFGLGSSVQLAFSYKSADVKICNVKWSSNTKSILREFRRYFLGASLFAVIGMLIFSADKVIMPYFIPLKVYGYFVAGLSVLLVINHGLYPITIALYDEFAKYFEESNFKSAHKMLVRALLIFSIPILLLALPLTYYLEDILTYWTGDSGIYKNAGNVLNIYFYGIVIFSIHNIILISNSIVGYLKLLNYVHILALIVYILVLCACGFENMLSYGYALIFTSLMLLTGQVYVYLKFYNDKVRT
ncbi:MATE family efflux transporter [Schleiferiaceae bacterium]|nr:MATE family efflux transporter [Schleiferiaceae bacterium]